MDTKPRSWAQLAGGKKTPQVTSVTSKTDSKPENKPAPAKTTPSAKAPPPPAVRPEPAPPAPAPPQPSTTVGDGEKAGGRPGPFARNFFNYPDNCQIFVGNLPTDLDEEELKTFFETFGKVMDLRIQRKNPTFNVPVSRFHSC